MFRKSIACLAAAVLSAVAVFAQFPSGPSVQWKVDPSEGGITITGNIGNGLHIYDTSNEYNPTQVEFTSLGSCTLEGSLEEKSEGKDFDGDRGFEGKAVFFQKISGSGPVSGIIRWQACNDEMCGMPEEYEFTVNVGATAASQGTAIEDPEAASEGKKGLWALIIEAILWGFAMLLTPCVFPMVPMTVSFFLKNSGSKAEGKFKAFMYGVFIVLLYTVPISLIILLTRVIGGDAVTADIFNWLSTHWLPNIIFFIVFMVFAASFSGAFEITLPSSWSTKSDSKSSSKGLAGVFFMALTLVLVSFSCTGPIVGSVLLKSTQGEFWTPMVTMLAFSVAFAIPFTVFALFPSLMTKMKSGGWLNSVKVVLGFIEVALGFKFLSVADQTYGWGILDREIYLAIWIVVFSMLGFYLLGKIRFKYDEKVEHISLTRLSLAIAVFTFVVYMIPGMFGAPLKALSGYLPPIETQDFVIANYAEGQASYVPQTATASSRPDLKLPHNLSGYFTLEEGLAESEATGKPVFVDITGKGCTNCREMEARVWSDPEVLERLRNRFVIVAIYCDDHSEAPESNWITTESGKVLKEWAKINSYIARTRFNANAQPTYVLLNPTGEIIATRNYSLDIPAFVEFLDKAL